MIKVKFISDTTKGRKFKVHIDGLEYSIYVRMVVRATLKRSYYTFKVIHPITKRRIFLSKDRRWSEIRKELLARMVELRLGMSPQIARL